MIKTLAKVNERQVSRRIYHALLERRVSVAVDLVVVNADKLAKRRDTPGFIYRRALQEGMVCYDRSFKEPSYLFNHRLPTAVPAR